MVEEIAGIHRKFTPGERKQLTLKRVDEVKQWIAELRKQVEKGEKSWKEFDHFVARLVVSRERYVVWMKRHSLIDRVTGIPARRWLDFELEREVQESNRSPERPLGLLILDIDHFKQVNDKYGHPAGDRVLKSVAQTIQANIRAEDFLGRYGGEEFAVLVINPKEDTLTKIAERIREGIEGADIEGVSRVTVSIGGVLYKKGEILEAFIKRADAALYASKTAGRNRVTIQL